MAKWYSATIGVKCHTCGKPLEVRVSGEGVDNNPSRKVKCWRCGTDIMVILYQGRNRFAAWSDGIQLKCWLEWQA
jgi:ribosomal protein S27E